MGFTSEQNFSFARHTTYGCGGVAKAAYLPKTKKEACEIYDYISSDRFCILGNGSNVLAQDGLYSGSVLQTKGLTKIKVLANGNLYCDSGVSVAQLLNFCKSNGFGSLEFLSGIPASIGGVCFMNAGAADRYIAESVVSIDIYDGKLRTLSAKECDFSYKHSTMRDIKCLILGCELTVKRENSQKVSDNCLYYLKRRKGLPSGKSCGCVFKNPANLSAGKLIENAHLKGKAIGCASVSEKHANFIIANGSRAQDVYDLIAYVKNTVYQKFAIELEEEVCYIGDFK